MVARQPEENKYIVFEKPLSEEDIKFEERNINSISSNCKKYSFKLLKLLNPAYIYKKPATAFLNDSPPTENAECFAISIDPTSQFIAGGYSNGYVNIFNIKEKKMPISFRLGNYPVTSIKWNKQFKTTLLAVTSDGKISHWHTSSGKILHSLEEVDNCINSVDYSHDSNKFITAGNDKTVRIYDDKTKSIISEMKSYTFEEPGHSNRIFCVMYNRAQESGNMIVSGGWDKTVQFYDAREAKIIHSLFGPQICGDSIDLNGYQLLTGAWSTKEQIQIWDTRTLKVLKDIEWEAKSLYYPTYIYSAKFNKSRSMDLFGIGACNKALFKLFEHEQDQDTYRPLYGSIEMNAAVYSIDFAIDPQNNKKEYFAYGCGDGRIRVNSIEMNLPENQISELTPSVQPMTLASDAPI